MDPGTVADRGGDSARLAQTEVCGRHVEGATEPSGDSPVQAVCRCRTEVRRWRSVWLGSQCATRMAAPLASHGPKPMFHVRRCRRTVGRLAGQGPVAATAPKCSAGSRSEPGVGRGASPELPRPSRGPKPTRQAVAVPADHRAEAGPGGLARAAPKRGRAQARWTCDRFTTSAPDGPRSVRAEAPGDRGGIRCEPAWTALHGVVGTWQARTRRPALRTVRRCSRRWGGQASTSVSRPRRTTGRSRCHAFGPRPARALAVGAEARRTRTQSRASRQESGPSSRPCSPREFVATSRRFRPTGARCSPGFSTSPRFSPSSPWVDASNDPPLTGLALGVTPPKECLASGVPPKRCSWLPHRVSVSDEADRSLTRPADLHEVRCLVGQRCVWELGRPWLMVSPQVPGCIAVP